MSRHASALSRHVATLRICSSLHSLYSMLSTSASQLALMTFSLTPTVPQVLPSSSWLSMTTRTRGGGAGVAVDDADLVIDQLHAAEVREMAIERFSQGGVQGVHRAVALGHFVPHFVADAQLDGGFGRRARRRRRFRRRRGSAAARSAA